MTIQKHKYKFRTYSKEFPKLYRKERAKLIKILPKDIMMEHIGSTAVPGLGGKGIVDITIKTPKSKLNQFINKLEGLGYGYNSEHQKDARRIFLQKKIIYRKKERRIHIHLTLNNDFWNSFIVVRDYLIKHPKIAKQYAKIKKEAVKIAKGEGKLYRKHKEAFIKRITKLALKERV